jgi:hypothetical protein
MVEVERWMANLPDSVRTVMNRIESVGYRAYLVGGAVRDMAWKYPVSDWDLATDAPMDVLLAWYPTFHPGWRFGVVDAGPGIELAMLRAESAYSDRRHPDRVVAIPAIRQDLIRRDFTVNALAVNDHGLESGADTACSDLQNKVWRAVGAASTRFAEDDLRIFRLVRFHMTYGGTIAEETWQAARARLAEGITVSRERRLAELLKMLRAEPINWKSYRNLGLDRGFERPPMQMLPWKWPLSTEARLLYWIRQGFWDFDGACQWLGRWPLARGQRRSLIDAAYWLWKQPEPTGWAYAARLGTPGSRLLAEMARAQGYAGILDAAPLAITPWELQARFGLTGQKLGEATRYLRHLVAQDPGKNLRATLERELSLWLKG